jgi:14-3-3 protein epsilon
MEQLVYQAKLAEQAERYEDMVRIMKEVINQTAELSVDQRNLLSVGYKNVVGSRRTAWRTISALESKEESRKNLKRAELAKSFRLKIEEELNHRCQEVLDLITYILTNKRNTTESRVFFLKMQGDYYRYMAEYQNALTNKAKYGGAAIENAQKVYQQALELASSEMPSTHPIRLGLSLNYSVFFYEVKEMPTEACTMAKTAFDQAIAELDNLDEEQYKDSTTIMQLIRDNLTLWSSELQEQPKDNTAIEDL